MKLEPGSYLAVFDYQGFRERRIGFDIDAKGWQGLRLIMEVGGLQTADPPPEEWIDGSKK